MSYLSRGYITLEELKQSSKFPSEERLRHKRPVAVVECPQEIPCTPCLDVCPTGAVKMPTIIAIPEVDYDACNGCTLCVQLCPGLACFTIQYVDDKARVTLPHELLPTPKPKEEVILLNRAGEEVGKGKAIKVIPREKSKGDTSIVTVEMPLELAWEVRAIRVGRNE